MKYLKLSKKHWSTVLCSGYAILPISDSLVRILFIITTTSACNGQTKSSIPLKNEWEIHWISIEMAELNPAFSLSTYCQSIILSTGKLPFSPICTTYHFWLAKKREQVLVAFRDYYSFRGPWRVLRYKTTFHFDSL